MVTDYWPVGYWASGYWPVGYWPMGGSAPGSPLIITSRSASDDGIATAAFDDGVRLVGMSDETTGSGGVA